MENNNQKMLKITLFCFFVGILGIGIYNNQDGPVKSGLNSEIINKEIKPKYSIDTRKDRLNNNENKSGKEVENNKITDLKETSLDIEYGFSEEEGQIDDAVPFVNSIKIAKEIDIDKSSPDYREPIVSFHTITTLDDSITKNVNYYPSLFVWTSVNTENDNSNDSSQKFSEQTFNTVIKHKNMDSPVKHQYTVTASTPEWREWVEIDLTEFDGETYLGNWTVEVFHEDTDNLIESRTFNLIKHDSSSLAIELELDNTLTN